MSLLRSVITQLERLYGNYQPWTNEDGTPRTIAFCRWSRSGGEIFEREWKSRSTEISGKSIRCSRPSATWRPGIQRQNFWRARSMQAVSPNFWLHIALKWSWPNNSNREIRHRFWGAVAGMSFNIRKCRGWVRQMCRVFIGGWASAW